MFPLYYISFSFILLLYKMINFNSKKHDHVCVMSQLSCLIFLFLFFFTYRHTCFYFFIFLNYIFMFFILKYSVSYRYAWINIIGNKIYKKTVPLSLSIFRFILELLKKMPYIKYFPSFARNFPTYIQASFIELKHVWERR